MLTRHLKKKNSITSTSEENFTIHIVVMDHNMCKIRIVHFENVNTYVWNKIARNNL